VGTVVAKETAHDWQQSLLRIQGGATRHWSVSHYEVIPVNGAGGARRVAGGYLYRTQGSFQSMAASGASSGNTVRTQIGGCANRTRVQPVGGQAALNPLK